MLGNLTNAHRLKCQTISITDSLSKKNLILSKHYIMYTRTHYNTQYTVPHYNKYTITHYNTHTIIKSIKIQ